MTNCGCQGVGQMFGERTARRDLRRYRKRGPSRPTRLLLEALVGRSAARARRLYGLVYPRERWSVAFALRATNLVMRLARRSFRAHLHAPAAVDAVVRRHGLAPRVILRAGPVWQVAVYAREAPVTARYSA